MDPTDLVLSTLHHGYKSHEAEGVNLNTKTIILLDPHTTCVTTDVEESL